MMDATPVEERESWFMEFPGGQPDFVEFLVPRAFALKGHYAGRSPKCFSFAGANLRRKYGPDWRQVYPDVIQRRLQSWGLNTIANWSDESVRLMRRMPYTDAISSGKTKRIEGSEGYWGKFLIRLTPVFARPCAREWPARKAKAPAIRGASVISRTTRSRGAMKPRWLKRRCARRRSKRPSRPSSPTCGPSMATSAN